MEEGADEEHHDGRGRFPIADLDDGNVQVPHGPPMYRHIPCPPEGVDVIRVPPVAVEISISKM